MRGTAWIGLRLGLLLDYVNLEIIVAPVTGLNTLTEVNLEHIQVSPSHYKDFLDEYFKTKVH